jgi:hypothetical protein
MGVSKKPKVGDWRVSARVVGLKYSPLRVERFPKLARRQSSTGMVLPRIPVTV